jgi:hypothetical protein
MNVYCGSRSFRPECPFSLELLDGPPGARLRRPRVREVSVGFGLDCLVTTFMKNSG